MSINNTLKRKASDALTKVKKQAIGQCGVKFFDQRTGLLSVSDPESIDLLESWSAFKNHADNPVADQVNRIQNLLILQSAAVDLMNVSSDQKQGGVPKNFLSRTTVFIPKSHRAPQLFQSYYLTFIDQNAKVSSCPGFMVELKLNDFNQRLTLLRNRLNLNVTMLDEEKEEDDKINMWVKKLKTYAGVDSHFLQNEVQESYCYMVGQFQAGDLVLFMPGTIHSVIEATDPTILRCKVSTELCQETTRKMEISQGSYKKAAREFETKHQDRVKSCNGPLPYVVKEMAELKSEYIQESAYKLSENGVVVIREAISKVYAEALFTHCGIYMHKLLQFPNAIDLLNPTQAAMLHNKKAREEAKIADSSIRRQPGNSRSTIIAKDHGITGIGLGSVPLQQVFGYQTSGSLTVLFRQIYATMFDSSDHVIKDICIHLQTPI